MNAMLVDAGRVNGRVWHGAGSAGPAAEFAHYAGLLTGGTLPVTGGVCAPQSGGVCVVIGDYADLQVGEWAEAVVALADAAPDAYLVRTLDEGAGVVLVLCGRSRLSTYYAVYDQLAAWGVGFYFDEVRVPRLERLVVAAANRVECPQAAIRVYKPQVLGDYSRRHSFWFWDQARWEQSIRWCVQNRLNTVHLHCFAGMNWVAYRAHPEARVTNDPVMATEARIRMAQELIRYAHGFGLKMWIGFVTNGAPYAYADAHPEQACTGVGGVYEGDLCGRAGRAFLEATAAEYMDTYAEADGFVFWPPEGNCYCADCQSGRSFADLVRGYYDHLRARHPGKEAVLLDWSLPAGAGALPADMTVLNMHEFSQLPPYLARGATTVFDLIVNWDTASCTTVSPRVHDMHREMVRTLHMGVKGFEAHLVSAFSGELNIQAFAEIAWDPEAFVPEAFVDRYCARYYGDGSAALRDALGHLEAVWTPPFNAYTSVLVSRFHHWAVPGDRAANALSELTYYEDAPGGIGPVKVHRRVPREQMLEVLRQVEAHLAAACDCLRAVPPGGEEIRFLQVSAESQWRYAQWTANRYRVCVALAEVQELATRGEWAAAAARAEEGRRNLEQARTALLALKVLMDANLPWFETQRCVAERDLETWIGSQAVADEVNDLYASSVIGGRCMPTAGLRKLELLVAAAEQAVQAQSPVPLKPSLEELAPYVRYPQQRDRILRAMQERLAKA